jgi:hypothetical protein
VGFSVSAFDRTKYGAVAGSLYEKRQKINANDPTLVELAKFTKTEISTAGELKFGEAVKNFFSGCAGFFVRLFTSDKNLQKQLFEKWPDLKATEPTDSAKQSPSQGVEAENAPAPASDAANLNPELADLRKRADAQKTFVQSKVRAISRRIKDNDVEVAVHNLYSKLFGDGKLVKEMENEKKFRKKFLQNVVNVAVENQVRQISADKSGEGVKFDFSNFPQYDNPRTQRAVLEGILRSDFLERSEDAGVDQTSGSLLAVAVNAIGKATKYNITPECIREQIKGATMDKVIIAQNHNGERKSLEEIWRNQIQFSTTNDPQGCKFFSAHDAFELLREKAADGLPDTLDEISKKAAFVLPKELVTGGEGDSLASRFAATIRETPLEGKVFLYKSASEEDANAFLSLMHDTYIALQDEAKEIAQLNGTGLFNIGLDESVVFTNEDANRLRELQGQERASNVAGPPTSAVPSGDPIDPTQQAPAQEVEAGGAPAPASDAANLRREVFIVNVVDQAIHDLMDDEGVKSAVDSLYTKLSGDGKLAESMGGKKNFREKFLRNVANAAVRNQAQQISASSTNITVPVNFSNFLKPDDSSVRKLVFEGILKEESEGAVTDDSNQAPDSLLIAAFAEIGRATTYSRSFEQGIADIKMDGISVLGSPNSTFENDWSAWKLDGILCLHPSGETASKEVVFEQLKRQAVAAGSDNSTSAIAYKGLVEGKNVESVASRFDATVKGTPLEELFSLAENATEEETDAALFMMHFTYRALLGKGKAIAELKGTPKFQIRLV